MIPVRLLMAPLVAATCAACSYAQLLASPSPAAGGAAAVAAPSGPALDPRLLRSEWQVLGIEADGCEKSTTRSEAQLAETLDHALHDNPRPGTTVPPPGALLHKLRRDGVEFRVTFEPHSGYPMVQDSLFREAQRWNVPPRTPAETAQHAAFAAKMSRDGWMVAAVRGGLMGFGSSVVGAKMATAMCAGAIERAASLGRAEAGDNEAVARAQAKLRELLRFERKAATLTTMSAAVFAGYQAAMTDTHPEALDRTLDALGKSLPLDKAIRDDDVDAEAIAIEARYEKLWAEYRESHGGGVTSAQPSGAASAAALRVLPEDSPYRRAFDAAVAVGDGDYKSALKSAASAASKIIPPSSPFGAALGAASTLLGAL